MFTMMNNARLGVGVEGLSQADAALQAALGFAARAAAGAARRPEAPATIVGHADVRRMLMTMTATVAVARAICLDCALLDRHGARRPARTEWRARAAFLTPIAKAFGTDAGCEVSALGGAGLRRHGLHRGDRGRAVLPRRAGDRDLRGDERHPGDGPRRPQARRRRRGGAGADRGGRGDGAAGRGRAGARLAAAAQRLAAATGWMAAAEPDDRFAGAVPYLRAFALTLGGHYLQAAAQAAALCEAGLRRRGAALRDGAGERAAWRVKAAGSGYASACGPPATAPGLAARRWWRCSRSCNGCSRSTAC